MCQISAWVRVRVQEMVCCHDHFRFFHVSNNHLVEKIRVRFRTSLGKDLDRFNLSLG